MVRPMICTFMSERFSILNTDDEEVGAIYRTESTPAFIVEIRDTEECSWIAGYLNNCIAEGMVVGFSDHIWRQIHTLLDAPALFLAIHEKSKGRLHVAPLPRQTERKESVQSVRI